MPNYDYRCSVCETVFIYNVKYDDRDLTQECPECEGVASRTFATPPQIRTEKLSRTFVDGTKRDGLEDFKKVAELQIEQRKHHHNSDRYKEIKQEIKDRQTINRPDKYKLNTGDK